MASWRFITGGIVLILVGIVLFVGVVALRTEPKQLLGRLLEGDELLLVQRQSDFDGDFDIDFLDFTVFAALYEEEV